MQKYKSISVLIALFYLNVILQSICTYWFHIQLINMLMITHLLLVGGCILLSILLYREYKAVKNRQIYSIFMAFGALAFVGVGTLVLYWFFGITGYDLIFEAGIVVFVSVLLWSLGKTMGEKMRVRTEAEVYKKLAQEDQMTGMKNRYAYKKILEDLEDGICNWKNAVLIFMDMNHLKQINDIYGHGAGDELLIGSTEYPESVWKSRILFSDRRRRVLRDSSGNKNIRRRTFPQTGCSGRRI